MTLRAGFSIAIETNGTLDPPAGVDWICVSPKAGADLRVRRGDELKLVYPQASAEPERFVDLDALDDSFQPPQGVVALLRVCASIFRKCAPPRLRLLRVDGS